MRKGGRLIASIRDGAQVFEPFDVVMRRVQSVARSYLKPGESGGGDEFLADRRREAHRGDENG